MSSNPFTELEEDRNKPRVPMFPHKKSVTVRISVEASDQILKLIQKHTPYGIDTPAGYSALLELIGMYALTVRLPTEQVDEESQITTSDCRQSGFEDALQGNPQTMLRLYNAQLADAFQEQYLRGFFEGSFVRNAK